MKLKEKNSFMKKSKGITLIALVVTIIVLLILAGISINLILGDNGIITKAQEAKQAQEIAQIKEEAQMVKLAGETGSYSGITGEYGKTELLQDLNNHFVGSSLSSDRVTTKDGEYDIIVENNLNIIVVKSGTIVDETGTFDWNLDATPLETIGDVYKISNSIMTLEQLLDSVLIITFADGTQNQMSITEEKVISSDDVMSVIQPGFAFLTEEVIQEDMTLSAGVWISSSLTDSLKQESIVNIKITSKSFDRTYGVIEIEFLEGTSYTISEIPNEPNMGSNMKKVYWEEDGTEVVEGEEGFDETKWYSYIAQTGETTSGGTSKWANAVTVDSEGNITGYFVWIPRYAYRIVYFDSQEHEDAYRLTGALDGIVGYSDSRGFVDLDGNTPSDMKEAVTSIAVGENKLRPHPAFEDGSKTGYTQGEWNAALEGIWIAKYETSGSLTDMKVLPGESALVSQTIGDMYSNALSFSSTNKSHMLKNSEWGAMTYLTESKYGRNGTEVSRNTDSGYYTAGASGATVSGNPLQSTTGNYYGIYDTVGGAFEYVAGYIADNSTSYGNSFASTNSEAEDAVNNKTESTEYATVYNMVSADASNTDNYNLNINQKFGDAVIETSTSGYGFTSWNSNMSMFLGVFQNSHCSMFVRGGDYYVEGTGLYYYMGFDGIGEYSNSFRLTMCVIDGM